MCSAIWMIRENTANLLNNIGNVLRLQGKLEDALRYCKLALRIRRDLFQQNKISEYYIGLSLSTLGHIYHTLGERKEEKRSVSRGVRYIQSCRR